MSGSVAVVGYGYWGKNLTRAFAELGVLACVCDVNQEALAEAGGKYGVPTTPDFDKVLANDAIPCVAIAAPAVQHYQLTKRALERGKDVFVEKPLALRAAEGQELVELARRSGRILMVGHILEYHPAILELKRLVREGELGRIQYVHSARTNLGKLRTEENILWSFAPHDISAILSLLNETPTSVMATGSSLLNPRILDTTLTTFDFASGVKAHMFVSWLHPFKEQKLAIIADRKMAVFDDTQAENKLVLYPHRIDWPNRIPQASRAEAEVVPLPKVEPLKQECQHFLDCVAARTIPRTDGESGVRVLQVLEACEQALLSGHAAPVKLAVKKYQAHPTAVIDQPCEIGEGTKIWHFSHVMAGSRLGKNCNLGQNVVISPGVTLGNNVKIQNNVSVYSGVVLEDDVFCGPSMVFTNVVNPRSHVPRKDEYRSTLVKRGASLGANSTILCGITIGEYAFVAAGAVVTRDVPPYALMVGAPARRTGWMCHCGIKLEFGKGKQTACAACGREYERDGEQIRERTLAAGRA